MDPFEFSPPPSPPRGPLNNQHFQWFKDTQWTPEMDAFFIQELVNEVKVGQWSWSELNNTSILKARYLLNAQFGTNLDFAECNQHVQWLERRYRCFANMISTPGVQWDRNLKFLITNKTHWLKWMTEEEFEGLFGFVLDDEPMFEELQMLFDPPPHRAMPNRTPEPDSAGPSGCGDSST